MAELEGWTIDHFHQGVVFRSTREIAPVIQSLYDQRREMKKVKNPNEIVFKLLLNSTYGKFMQNDFDQYWCGQMSDVPDDVRAKLVDEQTGVRYGRYKNKVKTFSTQLPIGKCVLDCARYVMHKFEYDVGLFGKSLEQLEQESHSIN